MTPFRRKDSNGVQRRNNHTLGVSICILYIICLSVAADDAGQPSQHPPTKVILSDTTIYQHQTTIANTQSGVLQTLCWSLTYIYSKQFHSSQSTGSNMSNKSLVRNRIMAYAYAYHGRSTNLALLTLTVRGGSVGVELQK